MNGKHFIMGALLATLAAWAAIGKKTNDSLRREYESLGKAVRETQRQVRDRAETPVFTIDTNEVKRLRAEKLELLALRNEAAQLHSQNSPLQNTRAINSPAGTEATDPSANLVRLSELPDFVSTNSFVYAGFATPEAAAQTFFAAFRQGDMNQIVACLPPEQQASYEKSLQQINAQLKAAEIEERIAAKLEEILRRVPLTGYRIAGKRAMGNDTIVLFLQTEADTELQTMMLKYFGNEWKVIEAGNFRGRDDFGP